MFKCRSKHPIALYNLSRAGSATADWLPIGMFISLLNAEISIWEVHAHNYLATIHASFNAHADRK